MKLPQFLQKFTAWQSKKNNDQGLRLWEQGDLPDAEARFRAALKKNPRNAAAISNLGALLMALHQYDQGLTLLQRAVEIKGEDANILVNLGNAYHFGGATEAAIGFYRRALASEPDNLQARLNILRPLLESCDWTGVAEHEAFVRNGHASMGVKAYDFISPFNSIFLSFDRFEILTIAKRYADRHFKPVKRKNWTVPSGRRIRIGYLSSDFHDHPTLHLSQGIYALHDRRRFEIHAYSIGPEDTGPCRLQIMRDCDHFKDVRLLSDRAIAAEIEQDGIDILIDMKGYTGGGRVGILAARPAPIQVNYLGYPGTMGAEFIDFLIADPVTLPDGHEAQYAESVVRLPHTYQPTDAHQATGPRPSSKESLGLPTEAFVFCCFNNSAKIDKSSFGAWMKVLQSVPGSVLWLLDAPSLAKANLAKAATDAGVSPERILYAPILPKAAHLGRLQWADLTLDTFICNAHTTATDALWVGVPLVTKTGETFAARVATSLLGAVGLSELAVDTEAEYVQLAVQLATDPVRLAGVRGILNNRAQSPLFDTQGYTRALEAAYLDMLQRRWPPET